MKYMKEIVLCIEKGEDVNIKEENFYIKFKDVENFVNNNLDIFEIIELLNKYNFWNDNNIYLINQNIVEFIKKKPYDFLDFTMYNIDKNVVKKVIDEIVFLYQKTLI